MIVRRTVEPVAGGLAPRPKSHVCNSAGHRYWRLWQCHDTSCGWRSAHFSHDGCRSLLTAKTTKRCVGDQSP